MNGPGNLIYLTHAEVEIDPSRDITDWPLSEVGRRRHTRFAADERLARVAAIYTSTERKSGEGAAPVASHLLLTPTTLADLGENDRSSTGYLPPEDFEATADLFFARPDERVRGWETARAAQTRIVAAIEKINGENRMGDDLLVVGHGGVGALLRCHLLGCEITRTEDQIPGGGCFFIVPRDFRSPPTGWERI